MSTQLIYHTPETMSGGVSPFDSAIMSMVRDHDIRIACPYIGLAYLQRMIESASGWRVLTDVEEWLRSHSVDSRNRIVEFILENCEQIRHCKELHAKVLISGAKALSGSANFTEKGITGRVELSVMFSGCNEVEELRAWFDFLWSQTGPVSETSLRACVAAMPPPAPTSGPAKLPCLFPGVKSKLQTLDTLGGSPDAEQRLIARLQLAPDRGWAESWLDLVKELLETTGLTNEDPRLVMSLPHSDCLPITINRRYVLTAFRIPDYTNPPGHAVVEFILPTSMKDQIDKIPGAIRRGAFDPGFKGETEGKTPLFVSFSKPAEFNFGPEVMDGWREALLTECEHQRSSNFRKFHEPVVYRAATDLDYRRQLLDRAFPSDDGPA